VERYESTFGRLELVSRPPAAHLRGYVRAYTGYVEQARGVLRRREIPSGDVALIVSFGPSMCITDPREAVRRRSFVAGSTTGTS
jgi:hypothetical protein